MATKIPEYSISEFRRHVPKAFKHVVRAGEFVVRVMRRGTKERALLVNETQYRHLQDRVRELQQQLHEAVRGRVAGASFRLVGSAELTVPEEALFEAGRAEQAARAAAKSREL